MVENTNKMKHDEAQVEEILIKARELFKRYGLKKTSMDEIARALGKSKSSLYYYFEKKLDIFEEIVRREMNEFLRSTSNKFTEYQSVKIKLKAFSDAWFVTIREKAEIYTIMREEIFENMETLNKLKSAFELVGFSQIKDILNQGVTTKELKPLTEHQINTFSKMFIAMLWWTKFPIFAGEGFEDFEEQVHNMIDFLMEGIEA